MRLFFAVEIPPEAQKQIYESLSPLRTQAPEIRWIPFANLHITLKFLGEVSENVLPQVRKCAEDCVSEIKPGPFEITFLRIGAFPKAKSPRVIWCGVEESVETLSCLAEHLEIKLEALGFKKEKRPYRAHLTIGKVSPEQRDASFEQYIKDYEKTIFASISVNMISLMQSVLNPHGAVHSVAGTVHVVDDSPRGSPFGAVYQRIHQIYL